MNDRKQDVCATKRTLLKAGWVAPLIIALELPTSSFAQNVSGASSVGDDGRRGRHYHHHHEGDDHDGDDGGK